MGSDKAVLDIGEPRMKLIRPNKAYEWGWRGIFKSTETSRIRISITQGTENSEQFRKGLKTYSDRCPSSCHLMTA